MKLAFVEPAPRQLPFKEKLRKLDLLGAMLLIASVICLFLALQMGSNKVAWNNSKVVGLFIGFGLLGIVFGVWQWWAGENATVPIRFFKDRTVVFGSLYLFWDNMASYVVRTPTIL